MERVTIRHITPSAPTPLPPARRPLVLRLTSAAQDKRWRTSSAPRSCRRRSALLPASRRGGRPPCKQHERLVSPSPRPAASSRTSPSILYASTAHRGVAVTSRRRATAPPMRVAEVSSPACSNEGPSCPAVYRTSTPQGRARVAVAAGTYGAGCCARPLTAVVAAASEAVRGSQNERFERFDTSPVNRPTYVADHLPGGRESIKQPDRAPSSTEPHRSRKPAAVPQDHALSSSWRQRPLF